MTIKKRADVGRPLTWEEEDTNWEELDARTTNSGPQAKLTGLNLAINMAISAGNTVLEALGQLQAQISAYVSTLTAHVTRSDNPHLVTKTQVGLGNVDDTADAVKPVSADQAASISAAIACAELYADGLVTGLWDDRGNYSAAGNVFPSTGGSGAVGAVMKGDIWTISVAGVLAGHSVNPGDTVRAIVDAPGQTGTNWAIGVTNLLAPVTTVMANSNFNFVAGVEYVITGPCSGTIPGVGAINPGDVFSFNVAGAFAFNVLSNGNPVRNSVNNTSSVTDLAIDSAMYGQQVDLFYTGPTIGLMIFA